MRLLLLPGMDGTGRLFAPLLRELPPTLTGVVVAYPPDDPLGYAGLLPRVEAAAAGGGDFVVVGESFSGPLALMLAARRPHGLRGVVLCASFVRSPVSAAGWWRRAVRPWMFRPRPVGPARWMLLGRHRRGGIVKLLDEAVRMPSATVMAARAVAIGGVDVTAELAACPVPVLYLRAAEDRVVRADSWDRVRAARPDAADVVLPGPHLLLQVLPREAAAVLAAFCQRVAPST